MIFKLFVIIFVLLFWKCESLNTIRIVVYSPNFNSAQGAVRLYTEDMFLLNQYNGVNFGERYGENLGDSAFISSYNHFAFGCGNYGGSNGGATIIINMVSGVFINFITGGSGTGIGSGQFESNFNRFIYGSPLFGTTNRGRINVRNGIDGSLFTVYDGGNGDYYGSGDIKSISSNKVVACNPNANNNIGNALLVNMADGTIIQTHTGSISGENFCSNGVYPLTNGNYVIATPNYFSDSGIIRYYDNDGNIINPFMGGPNDKYGSGQFAELNGGVWAFSNPDRNMSIFLRVFYLMQVFPFHSFIDYVSLSDKH